jgi:hypothetical protein
MKRGVALYFVGSAALLTLAGCGRGWLGYQEREPWRREAELACLQSGAVKQTAAIIQSKPIEGPGICGAEYPFKVSALGEIAALGYAETLRPPGAVGSRFPIPPPQPASAPLRSAEPYERGQPSTLDAAAGEPDEDEQLEQPDGSDPYAVPGGRPPVRAPSARGPQSYPPQPGDGQQAYPGRDLPQRLGPPSPPGAAASATPIGIAPTATLACPMVSALDTWMAGSIQPAAERWFGQPVVEIKQISAYSCRGMNGQRGAPISEHAFGNALDIASFTLADGRRITVKDGWRGAAEEQGFLRDVHASACERFSTVLAPGSNIFHYDHIHVDLARRRSGRTICNPAAVPGEVIARRRGGPNYTGAIGRNSGGRLGYAAESHPLADIEPSLPRAVPGED